MTVGLLVAERGVRGSRGAAPDLLLVEAPVAKGESGRVLPVEIKCMHGPFCEGADYRRSVKLARSQLQTARDLVGRGDRGLILMLWFEDGEWVLRHAAIPLQHK